MVQRQHALYADSMLEQKESNAAIYGNVDFSILPERYVADAAISKSMSPRFKRYAESALSDPARVEKIRHYTMTGDRVADAYAALIPQFGFRTLVTMLDDACANGVETVTDAPAELVAFIRAMEATPDWVDMTLVEKGARQERIPLATISPFEDKFATALAILVLVTSSNFYKLGMSIPGVRTLVDKHLINKLAALLDSYGHADFITDAKHYRMAPGEL